jgi:hypothetical protein
MSSECIEVEINAREHINTLINLWDEKMKFQQWEEAENVIADISAAVGQMLVATQICERGG